MNTHDTVFLFRDVWLVAVLDTVTSILAGFPVFMTMGYIAKQLESSVEDVISSGRCRMCCKNKFCYVVCSLL